MVKSSRGETIKKTKKRRIDIKKLSEISMWFLYDKNHMKKIMSMRLKKLCNNKQIGFRKTFCTYKRKRDN